VDRYSENQYDDLTLGGDDDSYFSDSDDLFALNPAKDSPVSRLKSIVLSIDWEITDEVLVMFNEELLALRDVWAGEKINLVYVQALEKVSKYIYACKADAHPSAIKLLLTLYHNLEEIVSSENMTNEQKMAILREDVKAFEHLKVQVKRNMAAVRPVPTPAGEKPLKEAFVPPIKEESATPVPVLSLDEKERETLPLNSFGVERDTAGALMRLKAILPGLEGKITDEYLTNLKIEVADLKEQFYENASCLDLLRGIGELGEYIQEKKDEAHSEVFKVLHLLFEGLEHIVSVPGSPEEERTAVSPLLEKLQAFRTIGENNIQVSDDLTADGPVAFLSGREEDIGNIAEITPAFGPRGEEEVHGFWAEEEMAGLDDDDSDAFNLKIGEIFGGEFADAPPSESILNISKELALQGGDVEPSADDDSGEDALRLDGAQLVPALAAFDTPEDEETASALIDDVGVEDAVASFFNEEEPAGFGFTEELAAAPASPAGKTEKIPGLDVEEDDDEEFVFPSEAYPGPALSFEAEEDELSEPPRFGGDTEGEIDGDPGLDYGKEEGIPDFSVINEKQIAAALEGVNIEDDDDDDIMPPADDFAGEEDGSASPAFEVLDETEADKPPVVETGPASDTAIVFLLAENDEEQDSVQNLRMYSEEYVHGGTRSSLEGMLSERDHLLDMMQGRSMELNLLQLFSIVADSFARSDEPAGEESMALLRSTSQALAEVLADGNIVRDLEVLRVETGKVLKWLSSERA